MTEIAQWDAELGWMPVVPLPFYERTWRTLWRWRFRCVYCDAPLFKTEHDYRVHYALNHIEPFQEASGERQ